MRHLITTALVGIVLAATPAVAANGKACCVADSPPVTPVMDKGPALSSLTLHDQRGQPVALPDGRVWVVSFFYGSCQTVCPRIVHNLGEVAKALPGAAGAKVAFAAVTFDPERDTQARLTAIGGEHGLTAANTYVLRGDAAATATIVKAFGFDFKPDGAGGFRHVNLLAVMDGQGHVLKHFYGLDPNLDQVTGVIRQALQ